MYTPSRARCSALCLLDLTRRARGGLALDVYIAWFAC